MNRRTFVSAVSRSLLAAPLIAEAQRATTPRVALIKRVTDSVPVARAIMSHPVE
jgi:hypothetical protein